MKTEIGIVSDVLADGLPLLNKYVGEHAAQELASFVSQRSADATPIVMVFGIYNAGKSTLLNALIGEERAAVSARPETSVVAPYDWNGFTLLDTPGIDAPAEHEKVTREQLACSDIVLFVLGTDGSFDEKAIYDEICDVVAAGKPIMIIVNNKNGYTALDSDYRAIYDKILTNLNAAGQTHGINDLAVRVPVRLINAKLALKGRLARKDTLITASGLPLLTRDIEMLLRQTGAHEVAITLSHRVDKLINAALAVLLSKETSVDARLTAEQQSAVRGEKERVTAAVTGLIRRAAVGFRSAFYVGVETRNESKMQDAIEDMATFITTALEREISLAGAELSKIGATLAEADPISVSVSAVDGQFGDGESKEREDKGSSAVFDTISKFASQIGKEAAENAAEKAVHEALKLTKDWIPSLMKGVGKKGMEGIAGNAGRLAGKAAPFIGPAIDTARGIYDYYQESKKQEEHSQALQRRAQALTDHVDQTTSKLEVEFLDGCRAVLGSVFLPIEKILSEQSRCLARDSKSFVDDRQVLELLKLRLENAVNMY
jgi:small GTP-binding protein